MKINTTALRKVHRGIGRLPNCGEHPGTLPLVWILALSALGGWLTLVGSLVVFGSMYLWGAYSRALTEERIACRPKENRTNV